jgi:hypothetical protein
MRYSKEIVHKKKFEKGTHMYNKWHRFRKKAEKH